jgi:predicted nucleic acid-binding Zn ribbon protein
MMRLYRCQQCNYRERIGGRLGTLPLNKCPECGAGAQAVTPVREEE